MPIDQRLVTSADGPNSLLLQRLGEVPRSGLIHRPTELERWKNLSALLGADIWAKRDDLLPLALGGNKTRKLDFILGQALRDGVDTLITQGGVQSNHCRLVASAAAHFGMHSILYLHGDEPAAPSGNLLIDRLLGAEIRFVNGTHDQVSAQMHDEARLLGSAGRSALVIPMGGANALGTAGYVLAVQELAQQCETMNLRPREVVVAVGTGSTLAGIALGVAAFMPQTRVLGVNVGAVSASGSRIPVRGLIETTQRLLGIAEDGSPQYTITDDYAGSGYTEPTDGARNAIQSVGRGEGVLLDMTYTAKAMHALFERAAQGEGRRPLLFWHTGGAPDLFARQPAELVEN